MSPVVDCNLFDKIIFTKKYKMDIGENNNMPHIVYNFGI